MPITYLLPTTQEGLNYDRVAEFNRVMRDEHPARMALSDEDISTLLRGLTRRTIAKYRHLAEIPSRWDRQEAYDKGRDAPYRLSLGIEVFLWEDLA